MKYSEDELVSWGEVDSGIKFEEVLFFRQKVIRGKIRAKYGDLSALGETDPQFKLEPVNVGGQKLAGYTQQWSEQDPDRFRKLDIYRVDDLEQYIINFTVAAASDMATVLYVRNLVVDFRCGVGDAVVSCPSHDVEAATLWDELDTILDQSS